jgi:hypothetical protein
MAPESKRNELIVRRHVVAIRAYGIARERGLGQLVPVSGYLGGRAEAEGVVLVWFGV